MVCLDARAQELDAEQLSLIQKTVAGICNTVEEASGSQTQFEIEGKVSAKLRGLAKSFANIDAETSGRFTEKAFEGLTQDAIASALGNAALCREHLFIVMFEKITLLPELPNRANDIIELKWSRNFNEMVGSSSGNLPVTRIDLALNADRAPYNSPFLTEIMFFDLSCDLEIWIDKIVIPDYPNGIGGAALNEAVLPDNSMKIEAGTNGIAINFHSSLVSDGYSRQQRIAMEAGDSSFAIAANAFRRSSNLWSKSDKVWVSLAIAAPAEGCKGSYQTQYPASRNSINEVTKLIE